MPNVKTSWYHKRQCNAISNQDPISDLPEAAFYNANQDLTLDMKLFFRKPESI